MQNILKKVPAIVLCFMNGYLDDIDLHAWNSKPVYLFFSFILKSFLYQMMCKLVNNNVRLKTFS